MMQRCKKCFQFMRAGCQLGLLRVVKRNSSCQFSTTTKGWSSKNATGGEANDLRFKMAHISPGSYALLALPCFTFYLGVWQIRRRKWKLNLLEELRTKSRRDGVDVPDDLAELTNDKQYVKYILRGEFDHSRETCIGPRTRIGDDAAGGLISSSNNVGVHIITPFKLADRDATVLVNRGWLPMKQKDISERSLDRVQGPVTLGAVYRVTDKGSSSAFISKNIYSEKSGMWMRRDIAALSAALNSDPYFFDADENSSIRGGPIGGQTVVQLRNEHLSYIMTWFTLTVLMLGIWYKRFIRNQNNTVLQLMRQKQQSTKK